MPTWSDFVGPQLNALVAILSLGAIAVVALVMGQGSEITIPCVTGIAGIAGTLKTTERSNGNGGTTVTTHTPPNVSTTTSTEPLRG